jgi:hypothetical protein
MISEDSWKNPEIRLLCLRRATRNADGTVSVLNLLLNPTSEYHFFRCRIRFCRRVFSSTARGPRPESPP